MDQAALLVDKKLHVVDEAKNQTACFGMQIVFAFGHDVDPRHLLKRLLDAFDRSDRSARPGNGINAVTFVAGLRANAIGRVGTGGQLAVD